MPMSQIFVSSTGMITGTIKDRNGTGFQPTNLFLTLRDRASSQIINSKNLTALTPIASYVDANGVVTIQLTAADNGRYDSTKDVEIHEVVIKWDWSAGAKVGFAVGEYQVKRAGSA